MATEVVDALGATCPDEGSFYVCYDKPTRFVGCCTVDPCKTDDGICPDNDLRTTSFDAFSFNQIDAQLCVSEQPEVQWWTCGAIDVPFMGCCSVNPCEENGCPTDDLFAARLNDDEELAKSFMPEDDGSGDEGLSTGAIAGVAVGSAAGALVLAGLVYWFLKRRRQGRSVLDTNNGYMTPGAPSPFDSYAAAKLAPPSPYSNPSPNPQSPPYDQQSAFPQDQYWQNQQWGQLSPSRNGYQVSSYHPSTVTLTPGMGQFRDSAHFRDSPQFRESAQFGPAELPTSPGDHDSSAKSTPMFSPPGRDGEYIPLEGRADSHRNQPSELDGGHM